MTAAALIAAALAGSVAVYAALVEARIVLGRRRTNHITNPKG